MWVQLCCNSKELYQRIVQMIGYYESKNRQISIYQYMPGGTLQHRIFGELFLHIVHYKSN
jgi:hypothetical protein